MYDSWSAGSNAMHIAVPIAVTFISIFLSDPSTIIGFVHEKAQVFVCDSQPWLDGS